MADPGGSLLPDSPFGITAQSVIEGLHDKLMANLPGTRAGENPEALHDMRVASRRLRAALRVFRGCFPKDLLLAVTEQVKSITRALGKVRDQDVFIDFLERFSDSMPEVDLGWIIEREKQICDGARVQMLNSLDKIEESEFSRCVSELLSRTTMTRELPKHRFALQAEDEAKKKLDELKKLSHALDDPSMVDELHRMRIAAKWLRYTLEVYLPCFGKPLEEQIRNIKRLQELLGRIHDCDVWLEKLHTYENEPGLSPDRIEMLERVVTERIDFRESTYRKAVVHWNDIESDLTSPKLTNILKTVPRSNHSKYKESCKMEEKKTTDASDAEVAAPKPRRRAPRKTNSADSTCRQEANDSQPDASFIESSQQPPLKAQKIIEPVAAENPAPETVLPAQSSLASVVVSAKKSTGAAAARVAADGGSAKLAKQFAKIESLLSDIPSKMESLSADDTVKIEKWLKKLADNVAAIPGDGKLSSKKSDKLKDKTRTVRKKIEKRIE